MVLILAFKFTFNPKPKPRNKGQMDTTYKLCSKFLKADESLEKCRDPECDNMLWDCQRFKMLVGKEVAVGVKNDLVLMGTLHSVDQI